MILNSAPRAWNDVRGIILAITENHSYLSGANSIQHSAVPVRYRIVSMGGSPCNWYCTAIESLLAPHDPSFLLTDMKTKLQNVVDQATELINQFEQKDNPKKVILINRAKHGLKTYEIVMRKLIELA